MNSYYSNNLKNYQTIKSETHTRIDRYESGAYNCGGFALNTFDWLELDSFIRPDDLVEDILLEEDDDNEEGIPYYERENYESILREKIEEVAECCAYEILDEYSDKVRMIDSLKDLRKREYVFAFRVGGSDFHFIRRFSNGQWAHKRGSLLVEEIKEEEVFSDEWTHEDFPYCSKIYLFACKK